MGKKQDIAPNLYKIVDNLESDKIDIASKWIVVQTVKDVFDSYKISPEKFKDKFAVAIIEYFINVVKEEKVVGDCPVMSKLVKYLLDKDITPKQVFLICMGLRKIFISYIIEHIDIIENLNDSLEELADIFDANLSGVLDIFTTYYEKQQQKLAHSREQRTKLKQFSQIINFIHTKIIIVKNGKIIIANKSFFRLSGVSNLEEFYKYIEDDEIRKLEKGDSKYTLSSINSWLGKVCSKENNFNVNIYHQGYKKLMTYNAIVTEMPDEDGLKYIVSFNNISNFIEEKVQLESSLEYDQLTGFYNYIKFESLLHKARVRAQETNEKAALAMIDVPDLKTKYTEYDDAQYEFVIREVANAIKKFKIEDMFVARISESRFSLYIPMRDKQSCYDWSCSLFSELNRGQNRITLALSLFDVLEDENVSMLNIFGLIESANKSIEKKVVTDFEGIREFEFLEDQEKFISMLSDTQGLDMTTYYKELPVVSKNSFLESDDTSVTIETTKKQAHTIRPNSKIYFNLKVIGDVEAEVKEIYESTNQLRIHNFRVAKSSPIHRTKFRVKAEDNINVEIVFANDVYKAKLIDLNVDTMSVLMDKNNNLSQGDKVDVKTLLTIRDKPNYIMTSCNVVKVDKVDKNKKLIIECDYDAECEAHIVEYISMRQMQIVKEIKSIDKQS